MTRFRVKGQVLKQLSVAITLNKWDLWPRWVGGNTPNTREIYFLCFRIFLYTEKRKTEADRQREQDLYDELYGLKQGN